MSVLWTHHVAGGAEGVDGVAVAALAARPAGQVPGVGGAAVAVLTDDIWQAGTLTAELVTLTLVRRGTGLRGGAWRVTRALCNQWGKTTTRGERTKTHELGPTTSETVELVQISEINDRG